MRSAFLTIVTLAVFTACSSVASAKEGRTSREARERVARKACLTGDVPKGIDILADLFVETEDITYVFNQGRCFQQNHRWQEAVDRFQEYLRKSADLPQNQRTEAEAHIADCKAHLPRPADSSPPATAPTSAMPSPTTPNGRTAPVAMAAPSSTVEPPAVTQAQADDGGSSRLRIAGIAMGAAGLAAIGTGVAFAWKTHDIVDEMYANGYQPGDESSRVSYNRWGWVAYGVGTAALVGGAALYWLGRPTNNATAQQTRVWVAPSASLTGAVLTVGGGL
jgi:hypothetical protein